MDTKNEQHPKIEKNGEKKYYICEICDYKTSRCGNFKRHKKSYKHENMERITKCSKMSKNEQNEQNEQNEEKEESQRFECECGKSYKYRQGLYKHRKKCNYNDIYTENNNLKMELKYHNEISNLKTKILELTKDKELMNTTFQSLNINNNINNNINSFNTITKNNIKIFLSEKCANAISIQEFVKQLTISLDDIIGAKDNTVKGITSIIERNLKPFSITSRPVHSIEKDQWYMKDNHEWTEDNGDTLIEKAHRKIQRECLKAYANDEMDGLETEEQVNVVVFGTSDLNQSSTSYIKEHLTNACKIVKQ